jgi:hypothetical protein
LGASPLCLLSKKCKNLPWHAFLRIYIHIAAFFRIYTYICMYIYISVYT